MWEPFRSAVILVVLAMLSSLGSIAPAFADPPPPDLTRLAWLAGCWERARGERVTHETWMAPLGGTMFGMSRTVAGGKTTAWEHLRIEVREGAVFYVAFPSGQAETAFRLVEQSDSVSLFANPEHDFPQRIRYKNLGAGEALVQIEGELDGRLRVIDFPFQRVPCPGS
ncbi:MAG TPA: DUF6265 family protein [Thermoanaerobaculia bacterium]|nr:DUF6265 family protein [Thermoanaerobaculia bacterium]